MKGRRSRGGYITQELWCEQTEMVAVVVVRAKESLTQTCSAEVEARGRRQGVGGKEAEARGLQHPAGLEARRSGAGQVLPIGRQV